MQHQLSTFIARLTPILKWRGGLALLFCAAFMAAFSPVLPVYARANHETHLEKTLPIRSLGAHQYLKQHSAIRTSINVMELIADLAKSPPAVTSLEATPTLSSSCYALVSSATLSPSGCSYNFLRLNVLASQAHPPTLI